MEKCKYMIHKRTFNLIYYFMVRNLQGISQEFFSYQNISKLSPRNFKNFLVVKCEAFEPCYLIVTTLGVPLVRIQFISNT